MPHHSDQLAIADKGSEEKVVLTHTDANRSAGRVSNFAEVRTAQRKIT